MSEPPHHARILIAMGLQRTAVVMATDSVWVAEEVSAISAYCDDVGILDKKDYDEDPGVYLWEGVLKTVNCGPWDSPEIETEYDGKLRPVLLGELAELLDMKPVYEPLMEMEDPDEMEPLEPSNTITCTKCGKPLLSSVIVSALMGGPAVCGSCIDAGNNKFTWREK